MKTFDLNGNYYLEQVSNQTRFYYALDLPNGDLYEAEELYAMGKLVEGTCLYLIDSFTEEMYLPVERKRYVCHSAPVYEDGKICFAGVDFSASTVGILAWDTETKETSCMYQMPLNEVASTYNLMLHTSPLTLCALENREEDSLTIYYPEKKKIMLNERESFFLREGDRLYFSVWWEDENDNYFEKTVVRDIHSGEIVEELPGDVFVLPDGRKWLLK